MRTSEGEPYEPKRFSLQRPIIELNRLLFERGIAPPWVLSASACADYWISRTNGDIHNGPARYADKTLDIVDFLTGFWSPEVGPRDSVLELGCNAGPNLEGLRRLGYRSLSGVEINPAAVAELGRAFPALAQVAHVTVGDLDSALPKIASGGADVVLSIAVLQHLHPTSQATIGEIVRVAKRYICVIEAEWLTLPYLFARSYRRVFERLGAEHVRSHVISSSSLPNSPLIDYVGYTARLFRVPSARSAGVGIERRQDHFAVP